MIDPSKAAGQGFAQRSEELVRQMHGVGLKRLPGDRRHIQRARSQADGIALEASELANLRALAGL
ncbi:hypothetical protein D3C75_1080390 [compost metagenome]